MSLLESGSESESCPVFGWHMFAPRLRVYVNLSPSGLSRINTLSHDAKQLGKRPCCSQVSRSLDSLSSLSFVFVLATISVFRFVFGSFDFVIVSLWLFNNWFIHLVICLRDIFIQSNSTSLHLLYNIYHTYPFLWKYFQSTHYPKISHMNIIPLIIFSIVILVFGKLLMVIPSIDHGKRVPDTRAAGFFKHVKALHQPLPVYLVHHSYAG